MAGIGGRPRGRAGSGRAVAWGLAGQAAMLAGIAAAAGLAHAEHVTSTVYVWSAPGAMLNIPSPATGADMIPVTVAADGQSGSDSFPDGATTTDLAVDPDADLTFTLTMDIPAGADVSDASLMAASGTVNDWAPGASSLPIVTDQPVQAGTVYTFTVRWDRSARYLPPGGQWTLVLAMSGTYASAEAPVAQITVPG
jgi:hypothetical protein